MPSLSGFAKDFWDCLAGDDCKCAGSFGDGGATFGVKNPTMLACPLPLTFSAVFDLDGMAFGF